MPVSAVTQDNNIEPTETVSTVSFSEEEALSARLQAEEIATDVLSLFTVATLKPKDRKKAASQLEHVLEEALQSIQNNNDFSNETKKLIEETFRARILTFKEFLEQS